MEKIITKHKIKNMFYLYKDMLPLILISAMLGVIIGIIDTIFGRGLIYISEFRDSHIIILLPFLSVAGLFIVFIYNKIGKNTMKGMGLIFDTAQGKEEKIPKRLVPLIMITTWITHLFGGSAGREGVAVQIGGTVAHTFSRHIKIKNAGKILLIAGMAAGFAGLYETPVAAVFFALEVIVAGALEYKALIPAIAASFAASGTSHALGLEKFECTLQNQITVDYLFIIKLIILGIIFGIAGGAFAYVLAYFKKLFKHLFENPYKRIFITGLMLSVVLLVLFKGRYSGLGTNLINASFSGDTIYSFDWVLKFILTVVTLSVGFQGGEVTPLFSIGASLGVILGNILGLPIEFTAALGYACVFGSASNTFLAPVFIGAEVFGFQYIPYFFVCAGISYIFNGNKSIYGAQKILNSDIINKDSVV